MEKYIKLFETNVEYETYKVSDDYVEPNVCLEKDNNKVHYNRWTDPRLIVRYTVLNDSTPTSLYCYGEDVFAVGWFSKVDIDGVEVLPSALDASEGLYQLSEGEHIVKYTLEDPTILCNTTNAFEGCTTITSVSIPKTVTDICEYAFSNTGLELINIPDRVTSIGEGAFSGCGSLATVKIGSGVSSIGEHAFDGCNGIWSIVVDENNDTYDSRNNCNAIIQTATNTLIVGSNDENIPGTVTSIGKEAFKDRTIETLAIPDSVTSIGNNAFQNCTVLRSVTIGNSMTSIGSYAFNGCTLLASIVSSATTAPTIQSNTFQNVKANGSLQVPSNNSGYNVWMGNGDYYLGKYGWTMSTY